MLKKEARKALCMLMTTAMVITGSGIPVNAAESMEGMYAGAESETMPEETSEEGSSETVISQTTDAVESETETPADIETKTEAESEPKLTEETETEEESIPQGEVLRTQQEEESTDAETDEQLEIAQASDNIASGAYENTKWMIDSAGKLTVTGTGEYCSYPQWKAAPWYPYREQIKTAVVDLKDIERPCYMFDGCVNMTSVDISKFDTSKSWDFMALFSECRSLKSIDLSRLDGKGRKHGKYVLLCGKSQKHYIWQ